MSFVAGQVLTASQMNILEQRSPTGMVTPYVGLSAPSGWLLCDGTTVSRTTYLDLFNVFGTTFAAATTTNTSTTVSGLSGMSSTVHVGWGIAGTNIPTGATISSVTNATTVVISAAATGTATGTANIAISPYGFTGAGNTTTFNLPNLKGRIPVGVDSAQTEFNIVGETGGSKTHTLSTAEMPSHTHTGPAHTHNVANSGTGVGIISAGLVEGEIRTTTTATSSSGTGNTGTAGSGSAHNNLQPYISLNFIVKT